MARHPRKFVAVLGASAIGLTVAVGAEPFGQVLWTLASAKAEGRDSGVRLRLQLQAIPHLRDARLRLRTPEGVSLRSVSTPGTSESNVAARVADGSILLGDLDRDRVVLLDLEFDLRPGIGGIAGFTVSGQLPDGRLIEESFGWTLAAPRGPPTRRSGAVEYPAALQPLGRE